MGMLNFSNIQFNAPSFQPLRPITISPSDAPISLTPPGEGLDFSALGFMNSLDNLLEAWSFRPRSLALRIAVGSNRDGAGG